MRKFWLFALVAAVGSAGAAEGEGLVKENAYNAWHLTIGPVMSPRVRVRVTGPRIAFPTKPPAGWKAEGSEAAPTDDPTTYADRIYDDGYVKPDRGTTEDPSQALGSDLTWNWGANNVGDQHVGNRMEFHIDNTSWTESYSASSFQTGSGSESDRDFLVGVEAMGGWTFFNDGLFDASVDAGFRFYGSGYLDSASRYGTSVTTTHTNYRTVDSYDASKWTTDPPGGTYTGSEIGPSRLIGALPERRTEFQDTTESTKNYYYIGNSRLNYRIWDLRLGPTVGWQAMDCLVIRGGVYGLFGLVDASLKTAASTSSGPYAASTSTCGAVFGLAFGLSAQLYMTDDLFLYGGTEYDWWSDSIDLSAAGSTAEIKLSDMTISLGLGFEF